MILYLDMGNSRIKLLLLEDELASAPLFQVEYAEADWLAVVSERPERIIGLCVAAEAYAGRMQQICQQRWGQSIHWLRSSDCAAGLTNAYQVPENLGVDRWAAMAGAHALHPGDLIVADFGTATTLDAITAEGRHLGGWIVPGVDAMRQLQQSRLPQLFRPGAPAGKVTRLANSTVDALESGVWQTQAGALQRFMTMATQAGMSSPTWILTGGYAGQIEPLLEQAVQTEPRLVFYGMRELASLSST